jgi:hypothetical protein
MAVDRAIERIASDQERQPDRDYPEPAVLLDLLARKAEIDHPVESNGIDWNSCNIAPSLVPAPRGKPMIFAPERDCAPVPQCARTARCTTFGIHRPANPGPGIENLHRIDASFANCRIK